MGEGERALDPQGLSSHGHEKERKEEGREREGRGDGETEAEVVGEEGRDRATGAPASSTAVFLSQPYQ